MSSSGYAYYFVIVGKADNPLFELEYSTKGGDHSFDHRYLTQFVAHATLDLVDEHIWITPHMYLKGVDKFNEWFVTAFVGGNSRVRFLLLHDAQKIEDSNIRNFFQEMYELYTKFSMNPLYIHHTPIKSKVFDKKAYNIAKRYLP